MVKGKNTPQTVVSGKTSQTRISSRIKILGNREWPLMLITFFNEAEITMSVVTRWLFCVVILVMSSAWCPSSSDVHARSKKKAVENLPDVSTANENGKEGRFIIYENGTVLDTSTNLMWATKDNGADINWKDAKSYCENYRGGGYTDWRMPTQVELERLYKSKTKQIKLTNDVVWASETRSIPISYAAYFDFFYGKRRWWPIKKEGGYSFRVLPVRSGK